MDEKLKPVSPGELLLEEFLLPMDITKYRLAKEIGVPAQRIGEIVAGRRAITADSDLRLCRFFVSPTATGYAPRRLTTPRSPKRRWPGNSLASSRGGSRRREGSGSVQRCRRASRVGQAESTLRKVGPSISSALEALWMGSCGSCGEDCAT